MKRSTIGWIVAALLAIGGASFAWLFFFAGGSGEPTTDLTTPELANTTTTSGAALTTEAGDDIDTAPSTTTTAAGETVTFVIDQSQSTARFELDEELRGNPTRVVGTTDEVVGQVRVDLSDTSNVEFSDVIVNARTFTTGSGNRDRAIRGPVMLDSGSDENELITLSVTAIDGLAGAVDVGDTLEFTITGDLTVKGFTEEVSFDVSATLVDATTLEGTAETEVTRDMFEIGIPSVPGVANVTNEVLIALDFVAVAG